MPKRQPKPKRPVPSRKQPGPTAELRQALARRKKAELVDVLVELAQADRGVLRQLTARFDVATAPDELVAATRQAIADATDFDEREINRNFAYDYASLQRGETKPGPLDRLGSVAAGHAAGAGTDEARKLSGRDERRRADDRRHRRLLEGGP